MLYSRLRLYITLSVLVLTVQYCYIASAPHSGDSSKPPPTVRDCGRLLVLVRTGGARILLRSTIDALRVRDLVIVAVVVLLVVMLAVSLGVTAVLHAMQLLVITLVDALLRLELACEKSTESTVGEWGTEREVVLWLMLSRTLVACFGGTDMVKSSEEQWYRSASALQAAKSSNSVSDSGSQQRSNAAINDVNT